MSPSAVVTPPLAVQQRQSKLSFSERSDSTSRDRFQRRSSSTVRDDSTNRATSQTRLLSRSQFRRSSVASPSPAGTRGDEKTARNKLAFRKDVRTRLPGFLQRFTGYRNPALKPPYEPLPFPPFSWLKHIPLKYEVWLLSTIGGIVAILLIEIVMSTTIFVDSGTPLIIASFGAGAVLCFGTIESPLAQPRHVFGGQVISAIVGVCVTKLFRLSSAYRLEDTTQAGELGRPVWVSAAISFGLAFLAMQVTGTTHPP
jgi:hypothetical protein